MSHLQKQGNVADEELHPEEKNEGGCRHFFPAVGGHLGDLGVVVEEEQLIVWAEREGDWTFTCFYPKQLTKSTYVERDNVPYLYGT